MTSPIRYPELHQAFVDEGFVAIPNPQHPEADWYVCYQRTIGNRIVTMNVPKEPSDESNFLDCHAQLHAEAAAALRALWEETGSAHLEAGAVNLANTARVRVP